MKKTNFKTVLQQQPQVRQSTTKMPAQEHAKAGRDRGGWTPTLWKVVLWKSIVLSLGSALTVYGQTDPWSNAATKLGQIFSGPIAKGLALVALVVGGLQLAFGDGSSSRTVSGIIFGLGLALGAASFMAWLFT